MRVKVNTLYNTPSPFDPKSFAGKWRWIGADLLPTEADIMFNSEKIRLEKRLKKAAFQMKFTKNRFKRDMFRKRAEVARTQLAALLLSK